MDKISHEYILNIVFNESLDREQFLLKKYDNIYKNVKEKDIKDMVNEFIKNSREHIDMLKDKMIMLNIQKA